jgi:hypothetical protein
MALGVKTAMRVGTVAVVFNKTAINAIDDLPLLP